MKPHTQYFFSRCRNVVSVSDVIVALAAGTPIKSDVLPVDMLPAVVLLATIGLRSFEQQIVDDYVILIDRMNEVFKDPYLTHAEYDHPNLDLVSHICFAGARGEYFMDSAPDAAYMFAVYEELINAELATLYKPLPQAKPVVVPQGGQQKKQNRTRRIA